MRNVLIIRLGRGIALCRLELVGYCPCCFFGPDGAIIWAARHAHFDFGYDSFLQSDFGSDESLLIEGAPCIKLAPDFLEKGMTAPNFKKRFERAA